LKRLLRARAKAAKEAKETGKKRARDDGQPNEEQAARCARSDEPGKLLIDMVEFDEPGKDDDEFPFGDSENKVHSLMHTDTGGLPPSRKP